MSSMQEQVPRGAPCGTTTCSTRQVGRIGRGPTVHARAHVT